MGSPNVLFKTYHNALGKVEVEKCTPSASGENVFHLRRLYRVFSSRDQNYVIS